VCQSMKQNARSFEDPARYTEIANYFWACSQNCEKQQFASSGLSVRPSVHPHRTTWSPIYKYLWNVIFEYFKQRNCQENVIFIKILTGITAVLYMKTNTNVWSYLAHFFLEWQTCQRKSCRENQNAHFVFNNFFFKSHRLWDNVEKYCTAGQATDDNMARAHCMLDK